jgi:predicted pyridoxine 5'-phosphate oxidase superfamily flavin-nucleotide-binding protein
MSGTDDSFHRGERALHERMGVGARMAGVGRIAIRDFMPDQHREFFAQLPFLVVGSVDGEGQPWASVLAGPPGFVSAPESRLLEVRALPMAGDPLALAVGRQLGLLGIEPHTRRRNRVNGTVESVSAVGFSVRVQQSFGNCPKYIQARKPEFVPRVAGVASRFSVLDADAVRALRSADTFFIASAYPAGEGDSRAHGADVSHRGGNPGFIRVEDGMLRIPDYVGNNYFNTLGNLAVNPRSGVLVVDFASGDLLFVAVTVEILWSGAEVDAVPGAKRLLVMRVAGVIRLAGALGLRWGEAEVSPFLAGT